MKRVIGLLSLLILFVTPVLADTYIGKLTVVYRLLNPVTQEHLYTGNEEEVLALCQNGWKQESIGWKSLTENGTPVYRLFNPNTNEHLYTTDENEVNTITTQGWIADYNRVPVFYSGGSIPVFRLFNPSNGKHLLTADANEYNVLATQGWNQEGIVFTNAELVDFHVNPDSIGSGVYTSLNTSELYLFQKDNGEFYIKSTNLN